MNCRVMPEEENLKRDGGVREGEARKSDSIVPSGN